MRILQVTLKNIKSYTEMTISFHDGINFISGLNGAGKTTLIEAIGVALFDHRPYSTSHFIRYGERKAFVSVLFEANDDMRYIVERQFSLNNWGSPVVKEAESGMELDLHGLNDYKEFLKEVMNVEPDLDLKDLFTKILGVEQQQFITPFLYTDAPRREHFNSILKLDSYKAAFRSSHKLRHHAINERHQIELSIKELETRIEPLPEKREELTQLDQELEKLDKELEILRNEVAKDEKEHDELVKLKDNIQIKEKELSKLKNTETRLKTEIEGLEKDLEDAKTAEKKANESAPGYNTYLKADKILADLRKKEKERDKLNKKIVKLEKDIEGRRERINSESTRNDADRKKYTEKLTETQKEIEQLTEPIDKKTAEKHAAEADKKSLHEILEEVKQYNNVLDRYDGIRTDLGRSWQNRMELLEKITEKQKLIDDGQQYQQLASQLDSLRESEAAKRSDLSELQGRLKTLKKYHKTAAGGVCPMLEEPCRNVEGGDLQSYFVQQMDDMNAQIEPLKETLDDLAAQIKVAQKAEKQWQSVKEEMRLLKQLEQDADKALKEMERQKEDIAENHFKTVIEECYEIATQTADEVDLFEIKESTLSNWIPCAADLAMETFIETNDKLSRHCRVYVSQIITLLEKVETQADITFQRLITELTQLQNNRKHLRRQASDFKQNLSECDQRDAQIAKMKADQENDRTKHAELLQSLQAFQDLDTQIEQNETLLAENKVAYETYIGNKTLADRIPKILVDIESNRATLNKLLLDIRKCQEELDKLIASFSAQRLKALEIKLKSKHDELAVMANENRNKHEQRRTLDKEIKQMEKHAVELEKKRVEYEQWGFTIDLIYDIRDVLQRADEEIARVLLQSLSTEANNIYQRIAQEPVTLEWQSDFDVALKDSLHGEMRERNFKQLSGGEKMTAALSCRLALLKQLSRVKIGFFDEPTANLDEQRRQNLANALPVLHQDFEQIFLISHDDTFEHITDSAIAIISDREKGSRVLE